LAVRRVWSARVAEREPCMAGHAEFVICEQSIERTLAWLNRYRRLKVRYERLADVHQAFLSLGCALVCWNFVRRACEVG
jgi:transposase